MRRPQSEDMDIAKEIFDISLQGRRVGQDAAISATEAMIKLVKNINKSKQAKIEMLRVYAFDMGISEAFIVHVMPLLATMEDELARLGNEREVARLLTAIWLAKVLNDIEKGKTKHEQE